MAGTLSESILMAGTFGEAAAGLTGASPGTGGVAGTTERSRSAKPSRSTSPAAPRRQPSLYICNTDGRAVSSH
jgi:hypothetical protein